MKRSEIKDRNGREIWAGDVLRFADKREWYRSSRPFATDAELAELPYYERGITLPKDFEWLLSSEIQTYWEIVKRPKKRVWPKGLQPPHIFFWRILWVIPVMLVGCLFVAMIFAMDGKREAVKIWRAIW